jgi:hypothetical protein
MRATRRAVVSAVFIGPNVAFLIGWAALLDYLLLPLANALMIRSYRYSFFPSAPQWLWLVVYFAHRRREIHGPRRIFTNIVLPMIGIMLTVLLWVYLSAESTRYGIIARRTENP